MLSKLKFFYLFSLACITLTACNTPSEAFHQYAIEKGFQSFKVNSSNFQHIIYTNDSSLYSKKKTLHIYLDGDGLPWINHQWIAKDPSARNPMILNLMAMDHTPSILLGRPCYYGLHTNLNCHYRFWTSHRYSPKIVNSLSQALDNWLQKHPQFTRLVLIGYSGGGTLATLIAPKIQPWKLITLSANLDTDTWSKIHHYTPLTGSINPTRQPLLNDAIKQLHISGKKDTNIPTSMTLRYVQKYTSANILIIENQAHCCWERHWPNILTTIKQ